MSDNAIPIITTGDVTRLYFDGGSVFGYPHAAPSTAVAPDRTWDDEQLLDAAHVGAAGRDLHPDLVAALCARYVDMAQAELALQTAERQLAAAQGVAAGLELRLADLQLELMSCQIALDEERNAHQGTMFAREFAEDLYVAELAERNHVAQLHAEASARAAQLTHSLAQVGLENLHLRHELAGTTPVSVAVALDRAARAVTGMGAAELAVGLAEETLRFPAQMQAEDGETVVVDLPVVEVCCG